jgi:cytoskeletal protein CcmA (bactofilin family)
MRQQRRGLWLGLTVLMVGFAFLSGSGIARAAEFAGDERYVLERGQVISDDFYVSGGEVIIDGTVEGDLVVAGGYVEVNGVIMGDVIAAGGAIVIAGVVQDDVRAAGGAIIVTGSIGDDLIAAAGGGWPGMVVSAGNRTIPQGIQIAAGASIGGDAYVVGGQATVSGSIGRNLVTAMRAVVLSGRVGGNATLMGETIRVDERTRIQGTLTYRTANEITVPEGVAARVIREVVPDVAATVIAPRNPILGFLGWVTRTLLILAGLMLLGWLAWSFAPQRMTTAVTVLEGRPVEAAIYGLLVAVAVFPVSAALVFLAVLFWGWFPGGVAMLTFLFGLFALLWLFSPVVTGLWLGRKLANATGRELGNLATIFLGVAVIVLVGRLLTFIPFLGELAFRAVYLLSFALAVGAWILARRQAAAPVAPPVVAAAADD